MIAWHFVCAHENSFKSKHILKIFVAQSEEAKLWCAFLCCSFCIQWRFEISIQRLTRWCRTYCCLMFCRFKMTSNISNSTRCDWEIATTFTALNITITFRRFQKRILFTKLFGQFACTFRHVIKISENNKTLRSNVETQMMKWNWNQFNSKFIAWKRKWDKCMCERDTWLATCRSVYFKQKLLLLKCPISLCVLALCRHNTVYCSYS